MKNKLAFLALSLLGCRQLTAQVADPAEQARSDGHAADRAALLAGDVSGGRGGEGVV